MKENYIGQIITVVVPPKNFEKYEKWLKKLKKTAKEFSGFLGMDVIRPKSEITPEYVILFRFKNQKKLDRWNSSPALKQLLKDNQNLFLYRQIEVKNLGLETFMNLPKMESFYPRPSRYKLITIGILTVYPLIVLIGFITTPVFADLPRWLATLANVCILSPLIGFLLPKVTRLFKWWL